MSGKATQDVLEALHGALATTLAQRIKDGTATASDLAVALRMLEKNGITADVQPNSPIQNLADTISIHDEEDDAEYDRLSSQYQSQHGAA